VLINGASGGVGVYAVQLARHLGAEVTGVCSAANAALVQSLGAQRVIDYTQEDFSQSGDTYDIIVDTFVGQASFARCAGSLAPNGRYLAVAGGPREMVQALGNSMRGGKKVLAGSPPERKEELDFLRGLVEAGAVRPVIDRYYPLEQMAEAHRYVDSGHKRGAVVITLDNNHPA
jgi:NADPH:quinone reductase-like Zn-dependent oxidoreductase